LLGVVKAEEGGVDEFVFVDESGAGDRVRSCRSTFGGLRRDMAVAEVGAIAD
jgi:hypothetical protein